MELPLPAGICLRQRYLIQHLLGQGRWGYTYLALDQERFGERCVLRQFHLPKIDKPRRQEEIKLYFQQEVNRLYQLEHPCIPRFWATFMEEGELFLVQEFIPGFSCRQLLLSRRQQHQTFSEAEVLALLKALLPCLDLLHQQGLSQGTLAPDAIVLRIALTSPLAESLDLPIPDAQAVADLTDTQPMLVTFGSFPGGLLRRLCQSEPSTTDLDIRHLRQALFPIGRMGFMPPEQVHGLEVHPHGDLYALAATCLVLLTGQDPEQLFDRATLVWRWPREEVSPTLARVLEQMLAWKPVDRYQSAAAVLAALNLPSAARPLVNPPTLGPTPSPSSTSQARPEVDQPTVSAPSSSMPVATDLTIPQGSSLPPLDTRPPAPLAHLPTSPLPDAPVTLIYEPISPHRQRWLLSWPTLHRWLRVHIRPGIILGLGLTGVLSLVWVSSNLFRLRSVAPDQSRSLPLPRPDYASPWASPLPAPIGDPLATAPPPFSPIPSPLVPVAPNPIADGGLARTLRFAPGEASTLVQGNLEQTASQHYILEGLQGQVLAVHLVGAGAMLNLLHSNGQAIDAAAYRTQRWSGQLPMDDRYHLEVSGYGAYTLEVALSPATAQLAQPETGWVRFAPGETSTTVTGEIAPGQVQRYLLTAQAQQLLVVQVLLGQIEVRVIAPNGQRLSTIAPQTKTWQARLPQAGDYMVEVAAPQASRFALKFEVY